MFNILCRTSILILWMTTVSTSFIALTTQASAQNVVPAQYIAKLYTEALGRAPDQSGWSSYVNVFQSNGCTASQLQQVGIAIYTSSEFNSHYTENQAKVITLYRGALNRDADQSGFNNYVGLLNSGTSWSSVVTTFFTSAEFGRHVASMCSSSNPDYGFGSQVPATPTPVGTGFTGTEAQLQAALNSAVSGTTVCVAKDFFVSLTSTLVVPGGVTLNTCGNPLPTSYASMARLARTTTFDGPAVRVLGGGTLTNVWVDGQRNVLGYHKVSGGSGDNADVVTLGGANTVVSNNKLSDPQGGSVLYSAGARSGYPCSNQTLEGNLVTAYSAVHGYSLNSDGLTMTCESTTIINNNIVDITDIGIVLFASPGVAQASTVSGNVIVSAGNSINAPISTDPSTGNAGGSSLSYNGTSFSNNVFWTGPYTTFAFGIEAGGREYQVSSNNSDGTGAVYTNNSTGILSANVRAGIAVAGMLNVVITNDNSHLPIFNLISIQPGLPGANCPSGAVIVEQSTGHASGTYPTPTFNGNCDGCI